MLYQYRFVIIFQFKYSFSSFIHSSSCSFHSLGLNSFCFCFYRGAHTRPISASRLDPNLFYFCQRIRGNMNTEQPRTSADLVASRSLEGPSSVVVDADNLYTTHVKGESQSNYVESGYQAITQLSQDLMNMSTSTVSESPRIDTLSMASSSSTLHGKAAEERMSILREEIGNFTNLSRPKTFSCSL